MRMPTRDLCADLRNDPDSDLQDAENVTSATNRQLRLYVAAWMLSDGTDICDAIGLMAAQTLYDGCGRDLLNHPGRLTTAGIASEVAMMLPADPEQDGRA